MRTRTRTVLAAISAATLAVTLAPAITASAEPTPAPTRGDRAEVHAPVPAVDWGVEHCPGGEAPRRVDCARVRVPLDYDDPTGATIRLFLARHRAKASAAKIGTLFTNPGGPGGSAAEFAAFASGLFPQGVQDRFDIVGIDPRGIWRSTPSRCTSTDDPPPFPRVAYPLTRTQADRWIAFDSFLRDACAEHGNAVLDHMSTADTARDMDLVRQALGEDRLSYYGISYGSYLGTTYAAMFPDRIRALVVDGVLDPVAWATGRRDGQWRRDPFSGRLHSQTGAFESLRDAFAQCDAAGKQRCRLAGHAAGTWRRLLRRLEHGPVRVKGFGRIHYQDLVAFGLNSLYDRQSIPFYFDFLEELAEAMLGEHREARGLVGARADLRRSIRAQLLPGPYGAAGAEDSDWGDSRKGVATRTHGRFVYPPWFEGVACSDTLNPRKETRWIGAARRAERSGRYFGRIWTWASGVCASWPRDDADAYRGPFEGETSAQLLVIGNTHDPATAYSGAVVVTDLFPSRLLTLNDFGHAAFAASDCIGSRVQRYLLHVRVPAPGVVCRAEERLFPR